jgi:hypothetical protein
MYDNVRVYSRIVTNILIEQNIKILQADIMGMRLANNTYGQRY